MRADKLNIIINIINIIVGSGVAATPNALESFYIYIYIYFLLKQNLSTA
jgi:hypothetical protein